MTQRQGLWCTVALALIWMVYFFGPVLCHPDDYMFGGAGDGAKNYYTFAYHVKHDASWLYFGGCNYPFGDHVTFTDGHPVLSLLFGWMPFVQEHPIGFLNVFMVLGLMATWLLLYLLLVRWGSSPLFAVAGAVVVFMGQPQLERLNGHLSLSAAWVIPLALLLVDAWRRDFSLKLLFAGFALQCFTWLLHPYLGIMVSGIMMVYPAVVACIDKKKSWMPWISMLGSAAVMLGYLVFVKLTDQRLERPPGGKGFLDFITTFNSLFGGFHGNIIGQLFGEYHPWAGAGEGKAYLGFVPIVVLVFGIVAVWWNVRSVWGRRQQWLPWLVVAIVFLAFAAGVPFVWGLESWVDKVPYMEQFRSPGRFVWVFYFILTCGCLAWYYRAVQGKKLILAVSIIAMPIVAIWDHWPHQHNVRSLTRTPNVFNPQFLMEADKSVLEEMQRSPKPPSAIWTIPQICYGSDIFTRYFDESKVMRAYVISFHSGIPILGTFNPRASLKDSRMVMQMTAPNVFRKEMWSYFESDACFYLLELDKPKFDGEERLVNRATPWLHLADEVREWNDAFQRVDSGSKSVIWTTAFPKSDEQGNLLMTEERYHVLASVKTDELTIPKHMQASVWLKALNGYQPNLLCAVDEIDSSGDKREVARLVANEVSYRFGDRIWFNAFFTAQPNKEYVFYLDCSIEHKDDVQFSDVLVQEVDSIGMLTEKFASLWQELGYR